ncbi:DUF6153 family protein [Streptomyces sp. uw30]|uniref:DUF6153 family protein n=1 Tax=Streptomyces sp. uw30 TaxID=1828179 RepID=UPI00165160AB
MPGHRRLGAREELGGRAGRGIGGGVRKPEEIYVADGTAYVKKGTVAWELRARTTTAPLTGVRDRGVVQKAATAMTATTAESVCHGNGTGGGHAQHADPTCASGAVGAGPAFPAPVPDPAGSGVMDDLGHRSPATAPDSGRAPPSLAELQILRT